ncbi:MAG: hypothetical protein QNJ32_04970 [Xenococcaceae cyanobacterium MO_167.B27]|nr:hypothetical protein [Xenococcaceae cyanobacterium MO_167.B27]
MEDWWKQLEKTAEEIEGFFQEISSAMEELTEEVGKTIQTFTQEVEEIFVAEIDRCIDDLIDVINESDLEQDTVFWEDFDNFVESDFMDVTTSKPSPDNHPACVGCRHYHGKAYNGNLLVCAMHPYGSEDSTCPDWEGFKDEG